MKKIFVLGFLFSSALASARPPDPIDPPRPVKETFSYPTIDNIRLDLCQTWGTNCGKPAADDFCKLQGYNHSYGYTLDDIDYDIGYTKLLTGEICNAAHCDGFKEIRCAGFK